MQEPWWKTSADEVIIGAIIGIIAVASIFKLGADGVAVATTSIGALGVYLGAKKTNGEKK